jgi:hypothetical protein
LGFLGGDKGDSQALGVVRTVSNACAWIFTIWPAPTTPSFFTSKAIEGVDENWRESEASLCEAVCDFEDAISLEGNLDSEAMGM